MLDGVRARWCRPRLPQSIPDSRFPLCPHLLRSLPNANQLRGPIIGTANAIAVQITLALTECCFPSQMESNAPAKSMTANKKNQIGQLRDPARIDCPGGT